MSERLLLTLVDAGLYFNLSVQSFSNKYIFILNFNLSHTIEYVTIYGVTGRFLATHSMFASTIMSFGWCRVYVKTNQYVLSVKVAFVVSSRAHLYLRRPVSGPERNTGVQVISPLTARNRRQMIRS